MSFYSFERSWSFCGLWDRQTGETRQIATLTHLLTIARCVIFKTHLALLLPLDQGCSTRGLVWTTGPSGCTLTDCKLALILAFTASNSLNRRPPKWKQQPPAGRSHWLQLALTLAFTDSNSLNWRPPNWKQQPSARRFDWLHTGSRFWLNSV